MTGHIVPMGAGKAVMDRRHDPLHDYVLELTGKDDTVVSSSPPRPVTTLSTSSPSTRPSTPGDAAPATSSSSTATTTRS